MISQLEKKKLTNTISEAHSIANKLLAFINKTNDPNLIINMNKFVWLVYNLIAMNQEDNSLGKDEKLLR